MERVFGIAKEICRNSNWTLTNLELQKILYIAQVFSYGRRNIPVFDSVIEAWDYGPVVPVIYHQFKYAGNYPISPFLFPVEDNICKQDKQFIATISHMTQHLKGWELVAITHRDGGAWKQTYRPGVKHLVITPEAIQAEYANLWRALDDEPTL